VVFELADGELRAVAPTPTPAALLPTLAQPAARRTTAAAHHGRPIRRTIVTTVFRPSSDNFPPGPDKPVRLPTGSIGCACADAYGIEMSGRVRDLEQRGLLGSVAATGALAGCAAAAPVEQGRV
jgi:hypothetical protein